MRIPLAATLGCLAGLSILATSRGALAVERQHHLGLAPSLAMLKVDDKPTLSVGAGLALHYTYGMTDQLNFMAELSSSIVALDQNEDYPEAPRTRPSGVDFASVGVGYVIDILRWVPYVGILAGAYRISGGTLESALILPGVAAELGLDYQLSRQWAIGLAGQQHLLVTKLGTYPSYTTVMFRFEYMWGF